MQTGSACTFHKFLILIWFAKIKILSLKQFYG